MNLIDAEELPDEFRLKGLESVPIFRFLTNNKKDKSNPKHFATLWMYLANLVLKRAIVTNLFSQISREFYAYVTDPELSKSMFKYSLGEYAIRELTFLTSIAVVSNSMKINLLYMVMELFTTQSMYTFNPFWRKGMTPGHVKMIEDCMRKNKNRYVDTNHNYFSYFFLIFHILFELSYQGIQVVYQIFNINLFSRNMYELFIKSFFVIQTQNVAYILEKLLVNSVLLDAVRLSMQVYDLKNEYYMLIYQILLGSIIGAGYGVFLLTGCWPKDEKITEVWLLNHKQEPSYKYVKEDLEYKLNNGRRCSMDSSLNMYTWVNLCIYPLEWIKVFRDKGYFSFENTLMIMTRQFSKLDHSTENKDAKKQAARFKSIIKDMRLSQNNLTETESDLDQVISAIHEIQAEDLQQDSDINNKSNKKY